MTIPQHTVDEILHLVDQGMRPSDIAASLGIKLATVYSQLRKHRPSRQRAPKRRFKFNYTRFKIEGLLDNGHVPPRVAKVIGVSRQYVYRIAHEHLEPVVSNIAKPWHNDPPKE